ncbi:hypothetical protein AB0N05_04020 [Nocardia sp. NPDC051030]|uniref:hypothetical protein n=1 Tax=Nocardia sp. NPDC051030 TaxID=3155162 RepID=UPI003444A0F9
MRTLPALATAVLTAAAVVMNAVAAYADPAVLEAPGPDVPTVQADDTGPISIECPPTPNADDPLVPIPPRNPLCGEDDWEVWPGITLRSNAYSRTSTIIGPDVSVTLIGSRHFQLRDHQGNLILGEPGGALHHVPFGHEIPPPPPEQVEQLTPHQQAVKEGLSRVNVGIMEGVTYTGDLTDMSAFLVTPIGSLIVQAPGTGAEPTEPGPNGDRRIQPINVFQVLDNQGRYVMGNTLTFGSPMAIWPNAAVPCPIGTVPITEQPKQTPKLADQLPDPVCKAPAAVPLTAFRNVDDPKPQDPVQRQKDINDAYSAVGTQFGLAVSIGAVIGGVLGLTVGCLAGGIGAGTAGTFSAALAGTATGFAGGCLTGAAILGSMGGTVGSLVLGLPVGIVSGVNAYNTLRLQGDIAKRPEGADLMQEAAAEVEGARHAIPPMVAALFPGLG